MPRCIDEKHDLAGTTVLVRAGLNAPVAHGRVVNDFRIRRALPTLAFLKQQGAKIIVVAHIGRDLSETLAPVAAALNEHLPVRFTTREEFDVNTVENGDIVLLENLRSDARETANDDTLAHELASLADVFVQDAFSVCHREHASVVGIPKYRESFGGLLLKEEIAALTAARTPEHPALFVLGGAKFATKEPLVREFLNRYDSVFIGGALQNEVLAARGLPVGASVVDDGFVPKDILESEKLFEVVDVVVERDGGTTLPVAAVATDDVIVDIGEETIAALTANLAQYTTVLWNGPLGWYEKGFTHASATLAHALAHSGARTIVGGGDTVAVIQEEGLEENFSFVSTGGGAMLAFLEQGTLPGIEALLS